ncbi:hypothetical protein KUCAC02_012927 [Chaenocephalus aceratus]|uniref:Uncharacterized protein n=1 Tax=Chaenocephalus aceratus TaxID=36190 RepID=A0ACB9XDB7_CHAAC|nr:hypothetical protein KUCAC02_012927 [Chaenocephalus aceratus]
MWSSQQNSPQLAQGQWSGVGVLGLGCSGAVEHHTALPLARGLQVLCGCICQTALKAAARSTLTLRPSPLPPHRPQENPTATQGQDPGHHCWRDLAEIAGKILSPFSRLPSRTSSRFSPQCGAQRPDDPVSLLAVMQALLSSNTAEHASYSPTGNR